MAQTTIKDALDHAQMLLDAGRFNEARTIYVQILNRQCDADKAVSGLAILSLATGEFGLAANLLRQAVALNPNNLGALMNLPTALKHAGAGARAIEVYEIIEEVLRDTKNDPEYAMPLMADNYGNWAGCYINAGEPERALELADRALAIVPEHHAGAQHRALALLEMGKWSEAWPWWDRRVRRGSGTENGKSHITPGFHQREFGGVPYWDGKETECLAVHGEQGLGDEIMFASVIADAQKIAGKVVVECNHRLVPMFERSFGVECYGSEQELMAAGHKPTAKVPLGSLLSHFRASPADCPGTPYLKADPALVMHYRGRLAAFGLGPKVAIAWRGGTAMTHEAVRKVPLAGWGPILNIPGITFVSVQYGVEATMEADASNVHHWQLAIDDMDRQLALMEACDLVVSVCQTAVHMAGALGKETWVLTPSKPRWCYGREGEAMAFYKSVRQFRQDGAWGEVIKSVAEALKERSPYAKTLKANGHSPFMQTLGAGTAQLGGYVPHGAA